MSYCTYVKNLPVDNLHRIYHDTAYSFPIHDDYELFGRLILEINQAGLSWDTILKKEKNFRKSYDKFNIKKIAKYGAEEKQRLLADAGIIRNRLKVEATIHNANVILGLQREFGSFERWLESHRGKSRLEWTKLFKQTFKFTGGEIVNEFLMSIGVLPGAHSENCVIYRKLK